MSSVLVLSAEDIAKLTPQLTPVSLITMSARLFRTVSLATTSPSNDIQTPLRNVIHATNHKILFMPSRLVGQRAMTAIKAVANPHQTAPQSIRDAGLPGSTLVFDEETAKIKALVNAGSLTAIRSGAGSALATSIFASPSSSKLVIFGAGAQAEWHARLVGSLLPALTTIVFVVRSPSSEKSIAFLKKVRALLEKPGLVVSLAGSQDADTVVAEADVICTCTPSTVPLFSTTALSKSKPVHINAIGSWTPQMGEFDLAPLLTSSAQPALGPLVVDSLSACEEEAGEIISAVKSDVIAWSEAKEIGQLISEDGTVDPKGLKELKQARVGNVSLFKAVGVGSQDVAIAEVVVELAETLGVGARVPF